MDDMGWTYKAQYEQAVTELEQVRLALKLSKEQADFWAQLAVKHGATLRAIHELTEV